MVMDFKSPSWGTNGKMGCPKSPKWESEGEAWSEDEGASSTASHEGSVCNDALHVFGLHGPGDKISLFLQEQKWHQAVTWPWTSCARKCMRPGRCVAAR